MPEASLTPPSATGPLLESTELPDLDTEQEIPLPPRLG